LKASVEKTERSRGKGGGGRKERKGCEHKKGKPRGEKERKERT